MDDFSNSIQINKQEKKMKLSIFLLFCAFTAWSGELNQIRLPEKASEPEQYAASELRDVLLKMTGRKFEIVKGDSTPASGQGVFVLGTPASSQAVREHRKELSLPEQNANDTVTYRMIDGNLYLAGRTPREVLYSVYAYLNNEHGVCWFFPGEEGEDIPRKKKIEANANLSYQFTTPFRYRSVYVFAADPARKEEIEKWQVRNFLNVGPGTEKVLDLTGAERKAGGHSIAIYDRKIFQKHPDWYAIIPGETKRTIKGNMGCWSNPGFHSYMVKKHIEKIDRQNLNLLSLFPADSGYYCTCAEC